MIVFAVAILLMLPITEAVYDFRTDLKDDTFRYETFGGTTANVTLLKPVYQNDTSTIGIISDLFGDVPVFVGYHSATRLVDISGLTATSNRTLVVSYDYDALSASAAVSTFIDRIAWIWLITVIAFAPAALVAMWVQRE